MQESYPRALKYVEYTLRALTLTYTVIGPSNVAGQCCLEITERFFLKTTYYDVSTLRVVILQLYWWLICSTKHCS